VQEQWHLAHERERVDVYDAAEGKVQGPPCRECSLAPRCEGIWARYVEGFGWEDLTPVEPTDPRRDQLWRVRLAAPCNNHCVHCADGPAAAAKAATPHVARQLRDGLLKGYRCLELGGGEPLLDERLASIVQQARNLGYRRIVVETNGRALNIPAKLEQLAALGVDEVLVRLNAGDEQTHDEMARAKGAFRQTLRGMLQLGKRGIPFAVRMRPHRRNVESEGRARQLALEAGARRFEVAR
jgi:MoaA/NifB/PqqE/SkfB family radical SAM enzyme